MQEERKLSQITELNLEESKGRGSDDSPVVNRRSPAFNEEEFKMRNKRKNSQLLSMPISIISPKQLKVITRGGFGSSKVITLDNKKSSSKTIRFSNYN
jgi:hypothetical protein